MNESDIEIAARKVEFLARFRGVPAYAIAQAINRIGSGIDYRGCNKESIADAWARRDAPLHPSLAEISLEKIEAKIERRADRPTDRENASIDIKLEGEGQGLYDVHVYVKMRPRERNRRSFRYLTVSDGPEAAHEKVKRSHPWHWEKDGVVKVRVSKHEDDAVILWTIYT